MNIDYTKYPGGADLIIRLMGMGIDQVADTSIWELIKEAAVDYIASAIDAFENETDFRPFLADAADSTRRYDPSGPEKRHSGQVFAVIRGGGRTIEFDGGLVSLTSLTTGMTFDGSGNPQSGTVRVPNRDFTLKPNNAIARKRPYEWIEMFVPLYGMAQSIQVVGRFGFCTELPANVWRAILDQSVCLVLEARGPEINGGMVSWKEADGTTETYREEPYGLIVDRIQKRFSRVVNEYRRMDMHL